MLVIGSLEQRPDTPLTISNDHTRIWVKEPLWGHRDPDFVYFKWKSMSEVIIGSGRCMSGYDHMMLLDCCYQATHE